MADDNLDKYLEDLGISVEEDEGKAPPDYGDAGSSEAQGETQGEALSEDEASGKARGKGRADDWTGNRDDDRDDDRDAPGAGAAGDEELVARCEAFLVGLLLNLGPAYAVEVSQRPSGEIFAEVYGGDPGKIIGRGGRTLAALEYLTNTVVNQGEERGRTRVNLDVGGYKRRRDDRLVNTARKAAARVRKTGFAVELEPMSAAERRVVHMELADNPHVYSESTGEGRDRRLVVKPR